MPDACQFKTFWFQHTRIICVAVIVTLSTVGQASNALASDATSETSAVARLVNISELPEDISELRNALGFCTPFADMRHRDQAMIVDDPGAFSRLAIVPCGGGGYNLSFVVFLESAGETILHTFDTYSEPDGWNTTKEVFNVEWFEEQSTLSTFRKGRSLGDCGAIGTWLYQDGTLHLQSYHFQPTCDGSSAPGEFPPLEDRP